MMRTVQFAGTLPKEEADALNSESGRISTDLLIRHSRLSRKQGVWLAPKTGERLEDALGGETRLHAHSRDAAQQGFYKACKTAKTCKAGGMDTKYPYRRKRFRTRIWKSTGISRKGDRLVLARARGLAPVSIRLPSHLLPLPAAAFLEARLVWDRAARHESWPLVGEDGSVPEPVPTTNTAAGDLGEIHPAALTDGKETLIVACRAWRANPQYTAKRLSELRAKQDRKKKGSRRWRRLQRRKVRFLAKQKRRARAMEQKVSRAVLTWATERPGGTLVSGEVRDVAEGKRLNPKSQQKIGDPSRMAASGTPAPPRQRRRGSPFPFARKPLPARPARSASSVTNPRGERTVARLAVSTRHRDAVGCANMLSQHYTGEPGQVLPPPPK